MFILFRHSEGLALLVVVILGLFIGFVFQGITKFLRATLKYDAWVMGEVINDESSECYEQALKNFKKKIKFKEPKENIIRNFYLMHDFILANELGSQAKFYTSRSAFWFNMLIGSLILFLTAYYLGRINEGDILMLFFFFSAYLSFKYFYAMYDVILKTYVMGNK